MKHEGYSKSWRVGLQGIEPGYNNEEITRRVFLTIPKSEVGLAAADRALLEDAPRLAEENDRFRAANAELVEALKQIVGNERRYEIPHDDYMQAVAALARAEGGE